MERQNDNERVIRTSVYLPRWIYLALKNESAERNENLYSIVNEQLALRYPERKPQPEEAHDQQLAAA